MRTDDGGMFWDTFFDVVSLVVSVVDVINHPKDAGAWLGLAGDVIDLVPGVTGVGETTRAINSGRKALKIADDLHDTGKAIDNLEDTAQAIEGTIDTYKVLKKSDSSIGKEVHHIVEKRFAKSKHLNIENTDEMLSIALDKKTHRQITNAWREQYRYGTNYEDLTNENIWNAAQKVYEHYPNLLDAAKKTIFGG